MAKNTGDMRRFSILSSLIVLTLALMACSQEKESEEFLAPEIVSVEATVDGSSVSLECELSSPRAETCGFVFWAEGEEKRTVISELSTTSFSANVAGLIPGKEYEWYAFARAGDTERRSETGTFTVPEPADEPEPVTPGPEPVVEPVGINIPDPYFKHYLLENFDADGDGALSEEEGLIIRKIDVVTDKISSMKGIEHFKNLDSLLCRGAAVNEYDDVGHPGLLDSLDVSSNRKLRYLACDKNMLRSLDISDNPFLEEILCSYNLLETIDLSAVPRLNQLRMWVNNVSALDFSNTPLIHTIECGGNHITSIDVSKCPRLRTLNIGDLRIKELDLSGNPMLVWLGTYGSDISELDLSRNQNLEWLNCQNSPIKELDLSPCVKLHELKCWDCQLEDLNVSMLPKLETLECSPMTGTSGTNILKRLYVSEDQVIQGVTVNRSTKNIPEDTQIVPIKAGTVIIPDEGFKAWLLGRFDNDRDGEISMVEAEDIREIYVCSDELNIVSLKGIEFMPNLEVLRCPGNWIGTTVLAREHYYLSKHYHWDDCIGPIGTLRYVDVTHNPKLRVLELTHNSGIGENGAETVDLSNNPELEELYLSMCWIKYPDISACPLLERISFSHGHGEMPDFSNLPNLRWLDVSHDQHGRLQPIDVSGSPDLEELNVDAAASSLSDLRNNPKLKVLKVSWCRDVELDLSAVPLLEEYDRIGCDSHSMDLSGLKNLKSLAVSDNPLGSLDLSGLSGLKRLVCVSCGLSSLDLSGMKNLEYLECGWNSITSLDFKSVPLLEEAYVAGNPLNSIDLSNNRWLRKLFCEYAGLSDLDVSHNPDLWDLRCSHNFLTRLDVSSNQALLWLYCDDNQLSELNLSNNHALQELDCSSNALLALDVSSCPLLRWMICGNNRLTSLDVSQNPHFEEPNGDDITGLFCSPMDDDAGNNLLQTLYVKKGIGIKGVTLGRSQDHIPSATKIVSK